MCLTAFISLISRLVLYLYGLLIDISLFLWIISFSSLSKTLIESHRLSLFLQKCCGIYPFETLGELAVITLETKASSTLLLPHPFGPIKAIIFLGSFPKSIVRSWNLLKSLNSEIHYLGFTHQPIHHMHHFYPIHFAHIHSVRRQHGFLVIVGQVD